MRRRELAEREGRGRIRRCEGQSEWAEAKQSGEKNAPELVGLNAGKENGRVRPGRRVRHELAFDLEGPNDAALVAGQRSKPLADLDDTALDAARYGET